MKRCLAVALLLALGCDASDLRVDSAAFCVLPGDSEVDVTMKCDAATRDVEASEGGDLVIYRVSHGKYKYAVEVEDNKVSLIRFTENPLPISRIRIGDSYAAVRNVAASQTLEASAEEQGYIALRDDRTGIYLSFDTKGIFTDWYFSRPFDEDAISESKLTSVNFSEPD